MILEEIKTSLIMWVSYALIPCLFVDGVAVLPAPQNLSMQSTNMKHVLTWSPVIVPEEIIRYSVEYQGEYESLYTSHIWIPSSWCSPTQRPECDITEDITATVSYSLRVRATLGSLTSAWSTLKHRFNQNSTILTPPGMEITMDGFHLLIKLEDLGPHFEFFVFYWRREPGAKEDSLPLSHQRSPVTRINTVLSGALTESMTGAGPEPGCCTASLTQRPPSAWRALASPWGSSLCTLSMALAPACQPLITPSCECPWLRLTPLTMSSPLGPFFWLQVFSSSIPVPRPRNLTGPADFIRPRVGVARCSLAFDRPFSGQGYP
uniref:Interleukin 20 receptor subunit beta n=1 Tax=Capra hircus TaxID=9925 RepID=A0A8C2NX56_CAPHI